jgi:hypothetical protein
MTLNLNVKSLRLQKQSGKRGIVKKNGNLKKLCQSWPLQSLKEVFGYDGGCQAHLQIWKSQEVTMNNDHVVQIQQILKQSFRFSTNL